MSQTYIAESQLPLYADLKSYMLKGDSSLNTKSGSDNALLLKDLLNWDESKKISFNGFNFVQVPFIQNSECIQAALYDCESVSPSDYATVVKKYYLRRFYGSSLESEYVVTMITGSSFAEDYAECDFDFLSKANYTGLILFSDINGNLVGAHYYKDGQVSVATFLKTGQEYAAGTKYMALLQPECQTKCYGGELLPSFCTTFRDQTLNPSYCTAGKSVMTGGGGGYGADGDASSYGGFGSPNLSSDESDRMNPMVVDDLMYSVQLTSNKRDSIVMNGSGVYSPNTLVFVSPENNPAIKVPMLDPVSTFTHWVGDFNRKEECNFCFLVDKDYESTAYFGDKRPCVNKSTGAGNPTVNMSIAASNNYGNYRGGTFGNTRNGGSKRHSGIDIATDIGTPVYSMYDGVIEMVCGSYLDVNDDNIPPLGNQVKVKSTLANGEIIIITYAHLQSGNAIGYNYRSGRTFEVGDKVYQGELIGYSGRSGNAYNVPNKHVHIAVRKEGNSKWIDPALYINGKIDVDTINENKGRIADIKCDD